MKQGEKINYFGGLLQSIYQKPPRIKITTKNINKQKSTHRKTNHKQTNNQTNKKPEGDKTLQRRLSTKIASSTVAKRLNNLIKVSD